MAGMRKGIPKEETNSCYGGGAGEIERNALEEHGAFFRVLGKVLPKDEVCINGRFAYTIKRNSLKAGRAKTDAHIDTQRRLDSRFRVKAPQ